MINKKKRKKKLMRLFRNKKKTIVKMWQGMQQVANRYEWTMTFFWRHFPMALVTRWALVTNEARRRPPTLGPIVSLSSPPSDRRKWCPDSNIHHHPSITTPADNFFTFDSEETGNASIFSPLIWIYSVKLETKSCRISELLNFRRSR